MILLIIKIFVTILKIKISAAQPDFSVAFYPKIENFHPPEGYQPVKGYEPVNYKPNRNLKELTIQTKKMNFQNSDFNPPAYYDPYYPINQLNNRYNSFSNSNNNQIGSNMPSFPMIPTTKAIKSFYVDEENWRRTPPSMY